MKPRAVVRRQQSGIALLMMLFLLLAAGSYAFFRTANLSVSRNDQLTERATILARAKEALIARAVIDANRPGSLPCPDTAGTGNANWSLARNDCDAYIGWLPWITLDLPELTDDSGTRLWYSLTNTLRDDNSAYPINSDTAGNLRIDGGGEIVAIIIAPGGALAGQSRPSNNAADYLEGDNANADENYIAGPVSDLFNDTVTIITRQELMAAVEKRVANELKTCIAQHTLTSNSYPWPAPFSSTNFRGISGSYFGRLPSTQPGAGMDAPLQSNIAQSEAAKNALSSATLASEQLTAVQRLTESLVQARNIFDTIYSASTLLWQVSSLSASVSSALNSELTVDLTPSSTGRIAIINSERDRIRTKALALKTQIDDLSNTLNDSGIDVFLNQLKARALISATSVQELLANSSTTHADIGPALANAFSASIAVPFSQASLTSAIDELQNAIIRSRINHHYSEVSPFSSQLSVLNSQLNLRPNSDNAAAMASKLMEAQTLLDNILTGATAINAALAITQQNLAQALAAAQASIDYPLINSTTSATVSALDTLVNTMIVNDDNLTRTSLATAVSEFKIQQISFAAMNLSSTTARVPYAISLQNATVDVKFWADIIVFEAYNLATQAKGLPVAAGVDLNSVTPLASSAYQITSDALASSQDSATALRAYINTPTTLKETQASTALAATLLAATTAISNASTLEATLASSTAAALPITWLSSRCEEFREGADSWWNKNQWKNLVFYQISEATVSVTPGTLKVNQPGTFKLVVIAAGQALAGQNRATLSTAQYFEDSNADLSRDNDATAPSINFSQKTPSASFNDRLAY